MKELLDEECIRASWEAERASMREFLLKKKFNQKSADKVISNYIDSMVFARLPCTTKTGIAAAFRKSLRNMIT